MHRGKKGFTIKLVLTAKPFPFKTTNSFLTEDRLSVKMVFHHRVSKDVVLVIKCSKPSQIQWHKAPTILCSRMPWAEHSDGHSRGGCLCCTVSGASAGKT